MISLLPGDGPDLISENVGEGEGEGEDGRGRERERVFRYEPVQLHGLCRWCDDGPAHGEAWQCRDPPGRQRTE